MKRELPPGGASTELLAEVVRAGEKAGRLTRKLRAVGSQEQAQPVKLAPNRVIEGMEAMLARMMGDHLRLEVVLGSALPKTCPSTLAS